MKQTQIDATERYLMLRDSHGVEIIYYSDILFVTYDNPYTVITTIFSHRFLALVSLSKMKSYLPDVFIQCNKASVINLLQTISIKKKGNSAIVLTEKDGCFSISRNRIKAVVEKMIYLRKLPHACDKCLFCLNRTKCTNSLSPI